LYLIKSTAFQNFYLKKAILEPMFSKEAKIFVVLFLVFSVVLVLSGSFGEMDYSVPGVDFLPDFQTLDGGRLELEVPENWEEQKTEGFPGRSSDVVVLNRDDEARKAKLAFFIEPEVKENEIRVSLDEEEVYSASIYGSQRIVTRSLELEKGKNNISISVEKCNEGCFRIDQKSLKILDENKIREEKIFFSKNWKISEETKEVFDTGEVQINSFADSTKKIRISFKFSGPQRKEEEIGVFYNNKEIDRFPFEEDYKLYTSKVLELNPGENIVKINVPTGVSLFVEDFIVKEGVEDKFYHGKNWYPKEEWHHESPRDHMDFHWMGKNGTLYLYNTQNESTDMVMGLDISAFNPPKTVEVKINNERVGVRDIEFSPEETVHKIFFENITFKEGENVIDLNSLQGCDIPAELQENQDERCLSFAVYGVSKGRATGDIRETVIPNRYYILLGVFVLFIFSVVVHLKNWKMLKVPNKKVLSALFFIFILAMAFRAVQPMTYQLYLDEPQNVQVSESLREKQEPLLCSYEGTEEVCQEYYKPAGYPFYLSVLTALFGFNLFLIFWNSVILGALSCALIFVLVYMKTKRLELSVLASLIFAVAPIHVHWSATAESYVTSFFFILVSLISTYRYTNIKKWPWLLTAVATTIFAVTLRIENIILVPIILLILYYEGGLDDLYSDDYRELSIIGVLLISILIYSRFIFYSVRRYISIVEINPFEITNYLSFSLTMPITLITLLFGLYLLKTEDNSLFRFTVIWTVLFSPVFLFHTGTGRMFIPLILVVALSAAKIMSWLIERIEMKKLRHVTFLALITLTIITGLLIHPINPASRTEEGKVLQTETVSKLRNEVPEDCFIITEAPSVLTGINRRKISTQYSLDNRDEIKNMIDEECLFYFEGIGCEINLEVGGWSRRCEEMKDNYRMKPFKKYTSNNLKYTLHEIEGIL